MLFIRVVHGQFLVFSLPPSFSPYFLSRCYYTGVDFRQTTNKNLRLDTKYTPFDGKLHVKQLLRVKHFY